MIERINIQPISITKTFTAISLTINRIDIDLNKSAKISYTLFSDDNKPVETRSIELVGQEYSLWGSDDSYIIDRILSIYE